MPSYLAILDFEANCLEDKIIYPQEIIEFPVILYERESKEIKGIFRHYCKTNIPITPFCTKLTGITQKDVDEGESFSKVLYLLDVWLKKYVKEGEDVLFCTCGDWDLKTALPKQASYSSVSVPSYLKSWCNVKKIFRKVYGSKKSLKKMMEFYGLKWIGRHHSGLDDCKNILQVIEEMEKAGYMMVKTY
jgi:inhibitor of KinA sporulation pathway (predicted exonuclease)